MADIQTLKNQLAGLKAKGESLASTKEKFVRASGLDESIEKERGRLSDLETDLQASKEELSELESKRTAAVQASMEKIQEKLNSILPHGHGTATIDKDGNLVLGWLPSQGKFRHIDALSGGERVTFDAALAYALLGDASNKVLILESGELDAENLQATLEKIAALPEDVQVVVNTWFNPGPESKKALKKAGWNITELGE